MLSQLLAFFTTHKEFISFLTGCLPLIFLPRKMVITQQDSSDKITEKLQDAGLKYNGAMSRFLDSTTPTYSQLTEFNSLGSMYFEQLTILCDRIEEGILNTKTVRNTHLPRVKTIMASEIIQKHYREIDRYAIKLGDNPNTFSYNAELYKSVKKVYDDFIAGDHVVDYRLKPLKWIWQKVRYFAIPFLYFCVFQLVMLFLNGVV